MAFKQHFDYYSVTARMCSYIWQIQRAEAFYVSLVKFFNQNGHLKVLRCRELCNRIRDQLYRREDQERPAAVLERKPYQQQSVQPEKINMVGKPFISIGPQKTMRIGLSSDDKILQPVNILDGLVGTNKPFSLGLLANSIANLRGTEPTEEPVEPGQKPLDAAAGIEELLRGASHNRVALVDHWDDNATDTHRSEQPADRKASKALEEDWDMEESGYLSFKDFADAADQRAVGGRQARGFHQEVQVFMLSTEQQNPKPLPGLFAPQPPQAAGNGFRSEGPPQAQASSPVQRFSVSLEELVLCERKETRQQVMGLFLEAVVSQASTAELRSIGQAAAGRAARFQGGVHGCLPGALPGVVFRMQGARLESPTPSLGLEVFDLLSGQQLGSAGFTLPSGEPQMLTLLLDLKGVGPARAIFRVGRDEQELPRPPWACLPPELESADEAISKAFLSAGGLEVSEACRAILTRLGASGFGSDLLRLQSLDPDDLACLLAYCTAAGLPPVSRRVLHETVFAKAVTAVLPQYFDPAAPASSLLQELDDQLLYCDAVDYFNEDTLELLVSAWGKSLFPARPDDPDPSRTTVQSHLLATKVVGLNLLQAASAPSGSRSHVYDLFLLERCRVALLQGLPPAQALAVACWVELGLHAEAEPPRSGELQLGRAAHQLCFLKFFLQEVDRATFDQLTQDGLSLDALFAPFLLSNFSLLPDARAVGRFWDLQAFFSLLRDPRTPQLSRKLGLFQLLQVWLLVDAMDDAQFRAELASTGPVQLASTLPLLRKALSKNLQAPFDQLVYSCSNFLFDTLARRASFERFQGLLQGSLAHLADAAKLDALLGLLALRTGVTSAGVRAGLRVWERGEAGLRLQAPHAAPPVRPARDPRRRAAPTDWAGAANLEEALREAAARKAGQTAELDSRRQQRLGLLAYLGLHGLSNPVLEALDELRLEAVKDRWDLEDLAPELAAFHKEAPFFSQVLAAVAGQKPGPEVSTATFELFRRESRGLLPGPARASLGSFFLRLVANLSESNAEKTRLLCELAGLLSALLGRETLEPRVAQALLMGCAGPGQLPTPASIAAAAARGPRRAQLIKATLGPNLLLADDLTPLVKRVTAFHASLYGRPFLRFTPKTLSFAGVSQAAYQAALASAQQGFAAAPTLRVSYRHADGLVKARKLQVARRLAWLAPADREPEPELLLGEEADAAGLEEADFLFALASSSHFYSFALGRAGLDALDPRQLLATPQTLLEVRLQAGSAQLGLLRMTLVRDLAVLDGVFAPGVLPAVSRGPGEPVYADRYPLSLLLQPVFVLALLLRRLMAAILAAQNDPAARQASLTLDGSLLQLFEAASSAALPQKFSLLGSLGLRPSYALRTATS